MRYLSLIISLVALALGVAQFYRPVPPPAIDAPISDLEVARTPMVLPEEIYRAETLDLPRTLQFAGEPVPLDRADVRESLDRELQINVYLHSSTLFLIKRANRWLPVLDSILRTYHIPPDFKYLPLIESGLLNDISPKEAVGFWQILKTSGQEYGLEITQEVDERYDPIKSTEAACRYLQRAHQRFGNWTLAAASYNRGMQGMAHALEKQRESTYYDLHLNEETARYVFRILAIREIVENPNRYGFKIRREHLYQRERLRFVSVNETIPDLVTFAKANGTTYKGLKRHNPWLRDDRLTVRKGKSYRLALPVE